MDRLKENKCRVEFACAEFQKPTECVYGKRGDKGPTGNYCHFDKNKCGRCVSAVAQVNAMFLAIKASGIPVEQLKKMVEAME
jgi:hypothetical protein